jgi:hypothetical protein
MPAGIQDTDEPSSDRLIQEGRPLMRRLFFFGPEIYSPGPFRIQTRCRPILPR